jgi:putative ABC transport system permease protein
VRLPPLDLKLLRDMWRMRGNLLAVAIVAACGAATYVTMRGAYEALVEGRASYYTTHRFADVFASAKRLPRTLLPRIERIPGVAAVEGRIVNEAVLDIAGFTDPVTALIVSVPADRRPELNDLFIRQGRYLVPGARNEVILGEAFATAQGLAPGADLAAVINGRWQRLRVVGVASSPEHIYVLGGAGVFPDNKRFGVMWMDRETLAATFDMEDGFNSIAVRLAPGGSERDVIAAIDSLLARYGGTGAYGRGEQPSHQMLDGEITQDRVTGIVVPAIFLGVAAFLIHNVLLRIITLQRSQIGVLKAFGYANREIAAHYLKMALATVLAGCAGGIALGVWLGGGLANMYENFFHLPHLEFRLSAVNAAGVLLVCALAAVAGALPAVRRALSLPPAEAMRPEAPARFRPLVVERLGYVHLLSPAARMLFRDLERRPLRAAASIVSMALATALLLVGQFGMDALDETVEVQFRAGRRDDVRLDFREVRGTQVAHDLTKLPGVTLAEAFRIARARIHHGHRAKRIVVFGLAPNAELQRIVDIDRREIPVPTEGMILSAGLAKLLGAKAGDVLELEFLEGERRRQRVPVASLVEEPIGLFAYMNGRTLAGLLGEGPAFSDAYLRVDPKRLHELYGELKRTPAVAGVTLREATIESFLDTVAENIRISTLILVGFACVIAAGVVYNGARIALSEQAVTLASLRILGFTRREVTGMLLGEQALLTLAAIPLGFVLGYALCAWLVTLLETELYRLPLAISARTYAYAAAAIVGAAIVSGAIVAWRVRQLDLIAVLKTRE